jgi:hypothetical protein
MYKQFLIVTFFLIFLISCGPPPFTTDVIMFDIEIYPPTSSDDIKYFSSRLDVPTKFIEIGTIKFEGIPIIRSIQQIAAEKGADAVIRDANNFILIKYQIEEEKKSNETKII